MFVCLMVFNAAFNNISVVSWRAVSLVEETGVPRETTDLPQVTDKLYSVFRSFRFDREIVHTIAVCYVVDHL